MQPKRILLAVTGLSPQIVTETLYALCVVQDPAWVPDEIHLITSQEGAERARLSLLVDPIAGQFNAFCRDYPQALRVAFTPAHIHTIAGRNGSTLPDIRTPEDNAQAADAIHALVREFTADPASELHVSIAGGRKTMGFCLGYCLSLAARPQDKLSHVLVSDPFESLPDFYYPPAVPCLLHTRDGRPIHTADARVMLAEIPFVRLRPLLPATALAARQSFSEAVAATQAHLVKPALCIDLARRQLTCGRSAVALPPQLLAWYAWFARRAHHRQAPVRHTDADPSEFLSLYAQLVDIDAVDYENTREMLEECEGFSKEFFEQKCAKINRTLKDTLGLIAAPYLIASIGQRPLTRYGLRLQADEIVWE